MNYQEIVNRIQEITNQHKMLADFGYGDLSDLKVRFENTSGNESVQADYPYLFLNPGVHNRNQGMVTYNFNLIVMDMARGEVSDQPYNNMLAIQSQCQQYIDDVIANLYYGYDDNPEVIYSGVTYTPFNERFQDEVSGMTATLEVQVPQPINNCIAPITPLVPPPPPGELQLQVSSNVSQTFPVDSQQSPWKAQVVTLDTQNGWRPPTGSNYFTPTVTGTWNFVFEGVGVALVDNGDWPSSPTCSVRKSGFPTEIVEPTTTNWPSTQPVIGETFEFRVEYTGIQKNADGNFMAWNWIDVPGTSEDTFRIESGTELKGYFTAS